MQKYLFLREYKMTRGYYLGKEYILRSNSLSVLFQHANKINAKKNHFLLICYSFVLLK